MKQDKHFIDEYISLCRKHHRIITAGIHFPHISYVHVVHVAYTNTEWEEYSNKLLVNRFKPYLEEGNDRTRDRRVHRQIY